MTQKKSKIFALSIFVLLFVLCLCVHILFQYHHPSIYQIRAPDIQAHVACSDMDAKRITASIVQLLTTQNLLSSFPLHQEYTEINSSQDEFWSILFDVGVRKKESDAPPMPATRVYIASGGQTGVILTQSDHAVNTKYHFQYKEETQSYQFTGIPIKKFGTKYIALME